MGDPLVLVNDSRIGMPACLISLLGIISVLDNYVSEKVALAHKFFTGCEDNVVLATSDVKTLQVCSTNSVVAIQQFPAGQFRKSSSISRLMLHGSQLFVRYR